MMAYLSLSFINSSEYVNQSIDNVDDKQNLESINCNNNHVTQNNLIQHNSIRDMYNIRKTDINKLDTE